MGTRLGLAQQLLDSAFEMLSNNLKGLKLEEAFFVPDGGFRSIVGTLKRTAGWSHVYRSYAFDASPISWSNLGWPKGLRDTIIKSESYLSDLIDWLYLSHNLWQKDLLHIQEDEFNLHKPVHWGETMPFFDIVRLIANHHIYHAGEINQLLSIYRHKAWEEGEEVEENNIASDGHRVVPPWKR